jgi:PleD family two-component response regulator
MPAVSIPTARMPSRLFPTRPRVLVADADDDTRALYHQVLERRFEVLEASEGRDALAKALTRPPPALVITELALPYIDGYALCDILRHDAETVDVPILVVTAQAARRQ